MGSRNGTIRLEWWSLIWMLFIYQSLHSRARNTRRRGNTRDIKSSFQSVDSTSTFGWKCKEFPVHINCSWCWCHEIGDEIPATRSRCSPPSYVCDRQTHRETTQLQRDHPGLLGSSAAGKAPQALKCTISDSWWRQLSLYISGLYALRTISREGRLWVIDINRRYNDDEKEEGDAELRAEYIQKLFIWKSRTDAQSGRRR